MVVICSNMTNGGIWNYFESCIFKMPFCILLKYDCIAATGNFWGSIPAAFMYWSNKKWFTAFRFFGHRLLPLASIVTQQRQTAFFPRFLGIPKYALITLNWNAKNAWNKLVGPSPHAKAPISVTSHQPRQSGISKSNNSNNAFRRHALPQKEPSPSNMHGSAHSLHHLQPQQDVSCNGPFE